MFIRTRFEIELVLKDFHNKKVCGGIFYLYQQMALFDMVNRNTVNEHPQLTD